MPPAFALSRFYDFPGSDPAAGDLDRKFSKKDFHLLQVQYWYRGQSADISQSCRQVLYWYDYIVPISFQILSIGLVQFRQKEKKYRIQVSSQEDPRKPIPWRPQEGRRMMS